MPRHAWYVSPAGHDANSGSRRSPFASIARALAASREPGAPRVVRLLPGTYADAPVTLGPADSGLVLEAAPGATPEWRGGRALRGWVRRGDWWHCPVPAAATGAWDFRTLLVGGAFRPRARLPRAGAFTCTDVFDVRWMSSTRGGWERKPTDDELTTLHYREGDLGPWLEARNAEVQVFHEWDDSLVGVAAIEADARRLRFRSPCGHPPGAFPGTHNTKWQHYVVWNVREGLHEPGQWYLDRAAGEVVYWPLPGEDPNALEILAPVHETLLTLAGETGAPLREVTVRGLAWRCTTTPLKAAGFGASLMPGALLVRGNVRDVALEHLEFRHLAGFGVLARGEEGAKPAGITVRQCRFAELGAGAMRLHGESLLVWNNVVSDVGLVYDSAIALNAVGPGTLIRRNHISRCSYSAITSGGPGVRIEENHFRDTMLRLDDGAAIYVFAGEGTIYRGNVVYGASGRWGSAYYLDERCRDCVVEDNLAVDTRWPSHNHMAESNVIRHNTFVDRGDALITLNACKDFRFERNVVAAAGRIEVRGVQAIAEMPANLFHSGTGEIVGVECPEYTPGPRGPLELRDGSRVGDPLFVEPGAGDYGFRPGSPAWDLGIRPVRSWVPPDPAPRR